MPEEPVRIELDGALKGHHILVDVDGLTIGTLEDMESGKVSRILDAIMPLLMGGDLPGGTGRDGLRRLKLDEFKAVIDSLAGILSPKVGT